MNVYILILVMALTTYLIRALPLTLVQKPIKNKFLLSFLHYVPCACLSAMTFPAILYSSGSVLSGIAALTVCILLSFRGKSLVTVACFGCLTVFLCNLLMGWIA